MKQSNISEPIRTLPKGIWESTNPQKKRDSDTVNPAVDLQQNGYPNINQQSEDQKKSKE